MARLSPDRTFRGSSDSFPLSAIAGQRDMALALILLGLAPSLGGLLLVGEKGTAKSTAARALAEVLPSFAARDCPYHCRPDLSFEMCPACRETIGEVRLTRPPFRTVPLGVSEERLLGGLDWEATLKGGSPRLRPGILGEANYGLAYVDEVNLLDPNLAHLLLDAASSGRVRVERDGLSLWHPAKFALLGSMNPEEGPLGPQLSDRFALTVRLSGEKDPSVRTRIIENRLAFENDPVGFRAKHRPRNLAISSQIRTARHFFNLLVPAPETSAKAVKLALAAGAAGHRADLGLCSAARAMKAWAMAGAEIFEVYAQALRDGRLSPPEHVLSEPPYVSLFDSSSRSLDFRFLTRPAHLFGHIGDDRPDEPLSPSALFADDSSPAESLALALDRTIKKSLAPVKVLTVEPEWLDLVQDYVLPERRRAPKAAATRAAKTVIKKTDGALEPNLPTLILAGEPEIPPDFHLESFDPGEQVHLTIYEAADSYEIITPQT
ncbi:MAG: ATP-binding protein, partial [Deltaproteobacteria bacterium]|nr:ATP-binding protein [Deltaproteobacteria bacterium]